MEKFKVCYFGTYREDYSRNKIMIKSLEKSGIKIIYCHKRVWKDIDERVNAVKKGVLNFGLIYKLISTYCLLIMKFFTLPDFDILMVGYPGQLDLFVAKILTMFRKKPIVWDVFMSISLISYERNLDQYNKAFVKFLKCLEKKALTLPELLIFDTNEYANWFLKTYNLKNIKYLIIPTGADDDIYIKMSKQQKDYSDFLKVVYYGTFIPNHGLNYIVEGAKILQSEIGISFFLIGDGPEKKFISEFVEKNQMKNIIFLPWQQPENLVNFLYDFDILLGAFGKTPQSLMTVQNKIYEGLSMGKLVVSGESPTVRNHLIDGLEIILCDRDNPADFAKKLIEIRDNKEKRFQIAENGHNKFISNYSTMKLGEKLYLNLRELIK